MSAREKKKTKKQRQPKDAPSVEEIPGAAEAWKDRALRAQAEMANMRRRMEEEVEDRTRRRLEALFQELITLDDHLVLALQALPAGLDENEEARPFVEGIRAIHRSLEDTFQRFGLEAIQPDEDQGFDPEHHEAVHVEERPELEGERLDLLRRGYRMGRRILRPAQVRVLKPAPRDD